MHLRITIVLERQGQASPTRPGLSPEEVIQQLLALNGSRDVSISIRPEGVDEKIIVAVDGTRAFLGLDRPGGLLQFAMRGNDAVSKGRPFIVGGQEAVLGPRYLTDISTAAIVVEEWLKGAESSSKGIPNEDYGAVSGGSRLKTRPVSFSPQGCWPIQAIASSEPLRDAISDLSAGLPVGWRHGSPC